MVDVPLAPAVVAVILAVPAATPVSPSARRERDAAPVWNEEPGVGMPTPVRVSDRPRLKFWKLAFPPTAARPRE
jgi:hypothetical protein